MRHATERCTNREPDIIDIRVTTNPEAWGPDVTPTDAKRFAIAFRTICELELAAMYPEAEVSAEVDYGINHTEAYGLPTHGCAVAWRDIGDWLEANWTRAIDTVLESEAS